MPDFLKEALTSRLAAASGRDPASLADTVDYLDAVAFLDADGEFDQEKVDGYVAVLGKRPATSAAPRNVVRDALSGTRPVRQIPLDRDGNGGESVKALSAEWLERKAAGGSVAQMKAARLAKLNGGNK